jgi:hypothetical protein
MKAKLPLVLFSLLHHPCPRHQSQVMFENNGISLMHVAVKFYTLIRVNAEHKPVPLSINETISIVNIFISTLRIS